MPFLKFSRDRRGYEHFSLVEPTPGRRGTSSRPRVLFWFRTPPQLKVGREPFTEDVRRAIEAQNPGLRFDWVRLMATPIPAPDAEHWRERRRAERAARQAGRAPEETNHGASGESPADESSGQDAQNGLDELDGTSGDRIDGSCDGPAAQQAPAEATLSASKSEEPTSAVAPASPRPPPSDSGGRRRRRRGRRNRHQTVETAPGHVAPNVPVPPTEEV